MNVRHDLLRDLVSTFCHEIEAPTRHIKFFTNKLKQEEAIVSESLRSEFNESIDFIQSSSLRLQEIISGTLRFSQFLLEKSEKPVSLKECVSCNLEKTELKGINVELVEEVPVVFQDRIFVSVFYELFCNSQKFGDKNLELKIKSRKRGEFFTVELLDNGSVLKEGVRQIKPFCNIGKEAEGLGLGLFFCKLIVENFDGQFNIEAKAGERFKVQIIMPVSQGNS